MELDPVIERFARSTADVVEQNLATGVTVGDLADAAGYSPFHFSRLFAKVFRTSPARYVAAVRFQRAKHLLLTQDFPVMDICHGVGFTSVSTFSRRFSQAVGVSPGALRAVADDLADRELPAFTMGTHDDAVTGRVFFDPLQRARLRDDLVHREPLVWIGTYAQPIPLGRPVTGVLRRGEGQFRLAVDLRAPWLLATTYAASADPLQQLAGAQPLVAMHPAPVRAGEHITLRFRTAQTWEHPVLTVLPVLALPQL